MQSVLDLLRDRRFPSDEKIFTADATAMYNNINTEHAIQVITWWLDKLKVEGKLPNGFPIEAVKFSIRVIMKNSIFQFGVLYVL